MVRFAGYRVNRISSLLALLPLFPFPCIRSLAGDRITIEDGTLTAEDGDGWMLSQIRSFEEAHPDVDVRHFAVGFPSRDEVRIEDLPELALNVIGVRSDMGYEIGYLVDHDLIVPLESFLPDPDFDFDDFFPNVWDYVTYSGHHWGVPYLCSSVALIADWDVFEKAGVSDPPKTWEDLLRVLPSLTRDTDRDGAVDQWGFRLGMRGRHDTHMFYLWMTKALQDGGYVMKEGRFDLSHPALRKAYDFMEQLQESPGAREDNRRFKDTAGDLTYRYGMQIVPSYYLNPLMKQHNYRIIPWVTSGEKKILDERRHYLCVCKSTPEKERASWEFLKWITRPNAEHPDGAWTFHLSARKDLLERKEVQHKIESWAKGFEVLHETKGWNVHHGDQVAGRFEAMDHFEGIVTDLFHGAFSFEEAMDRAERECNAILSEYRTKNSPDDPPTEIRALLERADSYRDQRNFKKATLDYLNLWKEAPGFVKAKGLRHRILACLRNAGYFLEAESLATTHRPGFVAGAILEDFQSGQPLTEKSQGINPDNEPLQMSEFEDPLNIPHLIQTARIACASAFYGHPASDRFGWFIEKCGYLLESNTGEARDWSRLALYHRGIVDLALRLGTHGDGSRTLIGDYALEAGVVKDSAQRILRDSIELSCGAAAKDSRAIPLVFDALDTRIEIGRKMGDLNGIVVSYRTVLDRFPNAEEAPKYLFDLAVFLREQMGDLESALAVCSQLAEGYAQSELSKEIRLKSAIWLYEARRYREAKPILETIRREPGKDRDTALVLTALCDYALGDKTNAENTIQAFIADNPCHELAQRARLWLLSNRIVDFQFLEATQAIRRFAEENPENPALPNVRSVESRLLGSSF